MQRFNSSFVSLIALCALSGCATEVEKPVFHSYFFDKATYENFYTVAEAGEHPLIQEQVYGAVVPHHFYVGPEFARFYDSLKNQKPSVVVVIGPNHFEAGKADIQTTDGSYDTPYGNLASDTDIVDELVEKGKVSKEEMAFTDEHSISAEVAFIKRTFPDAKLVPIILKVRVSRERAENLGKTLAEILPSDALVLASVDFSHYLSENVADFHDQTSLHALLNGDLDTIQKLEVDSPASLTALASYLQERGVQKILSQKHTNSASYGAKPELAETTSHFFLAFGKGKPMTQKAASVFFVGDTIVDRGVTKSESVLDAIAGKENRFFYGSTVQALNLEGPVTTHEEPQIIPNKISFRFDPTKTLSILKQMHIDTASFANNHTNDQGKIGRTDTEDFLKNAGIASATISQSCVVRPGIDSKIALCSFFDGGGFLNDEEAAIRIADAKKQADFVVVSVHWGDEYSPEPTDRQKQLAQVFIDAGANAVIGHGPHVIQQMEVFGSVPVFYSVGNFLFDETDPSRSSGLAVGLVFEPGQTLAYIYPLHTVGSHPKQYSFQETEGFFRAFDKGIEQYRLSLPGKYVIPKN